MLKAIGDALLAPDEWIPFRDHHTLSSRWLKCHKACLVGMVENLHLTIDVEIRDGVLMVRSPISRMRAMARKGPMR